MTGIIEFKKSKALTLGVELELQLVNTRDYDLMRGATALLERIAKVKHPGDIKPEITESMVELSTGIHERFDGLLMELTTLRDLIVAEADKLNLGVCGGGAHPFQLWKERRIYETPRFQHLSELYGYLAKQFTVFGQHVHIGCESADDAIYLAHALSRYIPHFIALTGASPFQQGVDTRFDSSRLTAVAAFPLSGRIPWVTSWAEFCVYFEKMRGYGVVESMKDFYWDIRPKPEFGTVEIRIFDTPLTVHRAAAVAIYAQLLSRKLLRERAPLTSEDIYLVYTYNRFQAARFGYQGNFIDPATQEHIPLAEDILATVSALDDDARAMHNEDGLTVIKKFTSAGRNGAKWMRDKFEATQSLSEVVREQVALWRTDLPLV